MADSCLDLKSSTQPANNVSCVPLTRQRAIQTYTQLYYSKKEFNRTMRATL